MPEVTSVGGKFGGITVLVAPHREAKGVLIPVFGFPNHIIMGAPVGFAAEWGCFQRKLPRLRVWCERFPRWWGEQLSRVGAPHGSPHVIVNKGIQTGVQGLKIRLH